MTYAAHATQHYDDGLLWSLKTYVVEPDVEVFTSAVKSERWGIVDARSVLWHRVRQPYLTALWHRAYALPVGAGGLAEAHAHLVDQVRRGMLP